MATIPIPHVYPPPYPDEDKIRNGKRPDWRVPSELIKRTNFALAKMRKCVFAKSLRPDNVPQTATNAQESYWRWLCRTGESYENGNTIKLIARATVLPTHDTGSGADRRWRFSAGASNSSWRVVPSGVASPSYDDALVQTTQITGLTPNTEYECLVTVEDGVRLLTLTVWEATSTYVNTLGSYVSIPSSLYTEDGPITDLQHADFVSDGFNVWKHNGAQLVSLCPDDPAANPWRTSAPGYVNLLQSGAATTPTANTAGVNPQVLYGNPIHTNNVACVVGAFGKSAAGAGNDSIIVKDIDNTTLATLSAFNNTGEWKSAAFNLNGTKDLHKIDFQFRDTGSAQFDVYAVSVFAYES